MTINTETLNQNVSAAKNVALEKFLAAREAINNSPEAKAALKDVRTGFCVGAGVFIAAAIFG